MKKRAFCAIIAFAMCLFGCMPEIAAPKETIPPPSAPSQATGEPVPEQAEAPKVTNLTLAYNANDSLNPFEMETHTNRLLVPLLYDSLTHPDRQWKPENQLATEILMEGTTCTIRWRDDARFSDGSYLTGKDIVYSFQTALLPGNAWSATLTNVASLSTSEEEKTVTVGLYHADLDFPALLSFPIVKEGKEGQEYPVGISKYYVVGAHNDGVILGRNEIYYDKKSSVTTIKLIHSPDSEALQFRMNAGEIDMLYHESSDAALVGVNAPNKAVSTNRLVYIGINGSRGLLMKPEFRHALSLALNRAEIAMTAYTGHARPAMYPFHPDFYRMQEIDVAALRNLSAADALLDGIGLTEKNDQGQRLQYGQPITLRLLVNSENSSRNGAATLIAEQLAAVGIKVEVTSGSFAQYMEYLQSGQFDLYIGETLLMDNMEFSPLLSGGGLGYNAAYSEELTLSVTKYRQDGIIRPLCEMFLAQSPFLPLVYRDGLLYTGRDFGAEVSPTQQDLFYNILDW